jgi:hypothetical protein
MPYTSNKKPSGLDSASSVGNDTLVIEQSGSVLKATVDQVTARVFSAKGVAASSSGSEVIVVRDGSTLKDLTLSNVVPALNITDAKVATNAAILGTKISPNFGSQAVSTTGQVSAGSLAVSGAASTGALTVNGNVTVASGFTINAPITGTSTQASQLATTRNIAATGDIAWNVNFNGSADVTAAATIQNNAVTNADLRDSGACSVIGRSANSSGDPGDISATADGQVLRRDGGVLGFGDVPIVDDAVTDAKLRNSAGLSVIGRSGNSTGNPADIVAATDGHALRLSGTSLGFGQIATTGIADSAVTLAKLAAAVQQALVPVGAVEAFARSTAPSGWLAANGSTIGSASSGATNASADYSALFAVLWDNWTNTTLPILDSAGAASTRGASASADFSANKRLPLPNLRGIFVRGSESQTISGTVYSGTFAEKQTDAVIAHTHSGTTGDDSPDHAHGYQRPGFAAARGSGGVGAAVSEFPTTTGGANTRHQHGFTTSSQSPSGDTETRPANIALLYCIKF